MPDLTLCRSYRCRVRADCRRNPACALAYPADPDDQPWAIWNPSGGRACPGYIEARDGQSDWRDR
jgi:hypothetical protein